MNRQEFFNDYVRDHVMNQDPKNIEAMHLVQTSAGVNKATDPDVKQILQNLHDDVLAQWHKNHEPCQCCGK